MLLQLASSGHTAPGAEAAPSDQQRPGIYAQVHSTWAALTQHGPTLQQRKRADNPPNLRRRLSTTCCPLRAQLCNTQIVRNFLPQPAGTAIGPLTISLHHVSSHIWTLPAILSTGVQDSTTRSEADLQTFAAPGTRQMPFPSRLAPGRLRSAWLTLALESEPRPLCGPLRF